MDLLNVESVMAQYKKQVKEKYHIATDILEWRSFSPGECIYEQGFPLTFLSFLVKGKVKVYMTSDEGKELIVTFNKPLELFGDIELVQNVDTLHTVEAVTPVHIGVLSIEVARRWREDAVFNEILLQSISRKFFTKSTTLSFHLLHEADIRLASYLASISHDEYGAFIKPSIPKSELKAIAEFIGITVRHQNRCIQSLERDGILKRIPGFIVIIDSKQLLQHAKQNIYEIQ
ncbi:Crp/Fnr family transcriptional regulator [Oceanobacillus chungangensis]|uniref:Crp/Fnr family transcriptional regulator n=1 Tax=Oceanobacillus chungangensis TaxID=1229152 RepID=A0A3D8PNN2_9BACI|nr:Crp/Fnr family transcriptional regulator [Oceanobacillus chungangensis]RDW17713.1 Crp/Fnr family transcriptional regulator [Oceanobacillus chungangensis]